MIQLKLAKLPDRTPIKLAIMVTPDLHRALVDYAAVYNEAYGQSELPIELIPHMLATFLASDRDFARERQRMAAGHG